MATQEIYKLLDILSKPPGQGTNAAAALELNRQRLEALSDLALRCDVEDEEVLDRLEAIVSADEETAVRIAAVKAIVTIFRRDSIWNGLATRLLKFLANDREAVWEQAANTLAELGPEARDAMERNVRQAALDILWARLGDSNYQPAISNSIARAILKTEVAGDNGTLKAAFDRLGSADPQARHAAITFLKTSVGWHMLLRYEDKDRAIDILLRAFRAVSGRGLLADIVSLIVDITPGNARLFGLLLSDIEVPAIIFGSDRSTAARPSGSDQEASPAQPGPSYNIVRWKQAVFLVDPRVRNFVNENILKRRVRLELKEKENGEDIQWYEDDSITKRKTDPILKGGDWVKIIDRSPHSNWFQIEAHGAHKGWIDAATELAPVVMFSLTDETRLGAGDNEDVLRCRYRILSLMLGELQDSDQDVRQNMIAWLRECDQYFTPKERVLVANALWECVQQYGQGLRAYAAIDLREEEQAMQEAVKELVYSHVDGKVIGLLGGLLLKEGARELDLLYETPEKQQDFPHRLRIMPFILGALESREELVCQLALVWVYRRASGGRPEDAIPGQFVRDLLTRMRRLADESEFPNVRRSARTNLIPITEKHSKFLFTQFDQKGALAIDIINELVEMDSPAVMSSLICRWGYWIAETDKSQLVEATALELRANKSAVLPLLERLREPLRFEDGEEVALKVKALNQVVPLYADQLLEKYLLNPRELAWWRERRDEEKNREEAKKKDEERRKASSPDSALPPLGDWIKSLVDRGGKYSELDQMARDNKWKEEKVLQEFTKLFWERELDRRKTLVMSRVALQLAEMSSPRFFEEEQHRDGMHNPKYIGIKSELRTHAVPYLAHRLPGEEDLTLREHMARTLANVGELEAVDALALAIVAEDRAKAIRQKVLAEYYLEPSKRRSEQAASILDEAVGEAKRSMRLIQVLSVATFVLGVSIVAAGMYLVISGDPKSAEKLIGLFASIGGTAGIIALLIKGPLNDIQNSVANLVQLETAFTNFIWELNLNSTYIQSEYVQEGVIGNDVVAATIDRMEGAMSTAMNVIALYAEEGRERAFAHINTLLPGSGGPRTEIKVMGQYLKVEGGQRHDARDKVMVAINHKRTNAVITSWEKDHVKFRLKEEDLPSPDKGQIWISLLVDGVETNALPFELKDAEKKSEIQGGNGSKMQPDVILTGSQPLAGGGTLPAIPDNPAPSNGED